VANQITGDIDLKFAVDIQLGTLMCFTDKKNGTSRPFNLYINSSNQLETEWSLSGVASFTTSTAAISGTTFIGWVRMTRSITSAEIKFYTSTDSPLINPSLVNWVQLGATKLGPIVNTDNSTANLILLAYNDFAIPVNGKIYRAIISNSIGGAPVVDFNPQSYNAAVSQTSWTSSTSEIWTINTGTAATGYKGCVVSKTIVMSDGVDDGLTTSGTITIPTVLTMYGAFRGYQNNNLSGKSVFGKTNIDATFSRNAATSLAAWVGAVGQLNVTGVNANVINLLTLKRKVSDNSLQVNNGTAVTNISIAPINQSSIGIFSVTTFGFSNDLFTTGVISSLEDNATTKTALYNIIRSMNGDAF
jgi:hypothetical protein